MIDSPIAVFLGFTTTAIPSIATGSSMYSIALPPHRICSFDLMNRDALEMSVSFSQNFLNPPPVPETPTGTRTPENFPWNSSATAALIGPTVLDPSTRIVPDIGPEDDVTSTIFSDSPTRSTEAFVVAIFASPHEANTASPPTASDPSPAVRNMRLRLIKLIQRLLVLQNQHSHFNHQKVFALHQHERTFVERWINLS